jgi:hypothetical protein
MKAAAFLAAVISLAAGGCDKDNGAYCDDTRPCPSGQTCDLVANQCSGSSPFDLSVPDLETPTRDLSTTDATPICATPCSGATPICQAPVCVGCDKTSNPEAACAATAGTPHCMLADDAGVGGGACVACRSASDCADPKNAICDGATHTCRPCVTSADCASGVCDQFSTAGFGECVDPGQVVYVDSATCPSGPTGTQAKPFCKIADGIGAAPTGGVVDVIGQAGGTTYSESPTAGASVTIVGNLDSTGQPLVSISPGGHDAFTVTGAGTTVTLYGIELTGATGSHSGLKCGGSLGEGKTVRFIRGVISFNQQWGIDGTNCATLFVDASSISKNGAGGGGGAILIAQDATITNNFVVGNGDSTGPDIGGITVASLTGSTVKIINDTIADNFGGTSLNQGISCTTPTLALVFSSILYHNHNTTVSPTETNCGNTLNAYLASDGPEGASVAAHNVNLLAQSPNFKPPSGNYHLNTGSPCINTGSMIVGTPDHDIDFEPRPDKTTNLVDIGADEVQ